MNMNFDTQNNVAYASRHEFLPQDSNQSGDSRCVTVEYGDTLSAIAAREYVALQDLIAANPQILNPDHIYPGDQVKVPDGQVQDTERASAPSTSSAGQSNGETSQNGIDLIKSFEGLRTHTYKDAVGVPTIGYGHTGSDVKMGQQISQAQAEQLLRGDLSKFEAAVRKEVKVPLTQGQFDALVSFTYNLGPNALHDSQLLKKLNAGDYAGAQAEFGKFVHAGGKVLPGLQRRREEEAALFGAGGE
jgi:GH24 family phage-related lysozyme (muramidase)